MKRNKLNILVALVACMLLFSGCIIVDNGEETTPPIDTGTVNKNPIGSYLTTQYQYVTNPNVEVLATNMDEKYLLLVNKNVGLDSDFEPSALTELTCATLQSDRTYELDSRAAQALYAMLAEMNAAGVNDIMVASAYRSYSYQVSTYNNYVEKEANQLSYEARRVFGDDYINSNYLAKGIYKLSLEDAHTVVQSYSAKPGHSEHQTGLCVDFITSEMGNDLTEAFENTAAFAWLSQNAYKFGFILRYPKGKTEVTGIIYEPWHYRFVGIEVASIIHQTGLSYEEYLEIFN